MRLSCLNGGGTFALLCASIALAPGCVGNIGDGGAEGGVDGPGSEPQSCGGEVVPVESVPLRRLTAEQYLNTLRDLTGDEGLTFELEDMEGVVTERAVRQMRDLGELVVERRAEWTREVFPCDVTGTAQDSCVDAFISDFGARAFRRPLHDDEHTWLRGVYDGVKNDASFEEAMEVVLQVMLQAPATVYMFEAGAGDVLAGEMRALSDYEVASRLSYFVWNTMPDDALFAAAAEGKLSTPEGLRAEADRLLDSPRAEHNVQRFFSSWLQLDGGQLHHALENTVKDAGLYPEYDAELQAAMRAETEAFITRTFFDEGGSFEKLFTANYAYVNGDLAALYGVDAPAEEHGWVELDAAERAGLFTRAAFLTVLSTANVTAPIRRGVWVMEEALCNTLGEPPANVDDSPLEGGEVDGETLTVREDVEQRTKDDECQACHGLINPLGFTFENYDAIGRFQLEEATSGLPVDSSGEIQASDVDGPVDGAVELSQRLSESDQVRACFAKRWSKTALGGEEAALDSCSQQQIETTFAETGDMRELLIGIIQSNAFRFINISEEGEEK
jgi:hypothetical protein